MQKKSKLVFWLQLSIILLTAVLFLAINETWKFGKQARKAAEVIEALRADKAELAGDLADIQGTPLEYLLLFRRATLARFERIEPRWNQIMEAIWSASKKHGVPAEIIVAKIEHESGFMPDAVGPMGEWGLTQINDSAWPSFDTKRGFDINYNADFGCMVFSKCLEAAKGNIREALRLYNGKGGLMDGMIPYADRVLNGRFMKIK